MFSEKTEVRIIRQIELSEAVLSLRSYGIVLVFYTDNTILYITVQLKIADKYNITIEECQNKCIPHDNIADTIKNTFDNLKLNININNKTATQLDESSTCINQIDQVDQIDNINN